MNTASRRSIAAKLVEENSDEEFKQLLTSLPKQKGMAFTLYQFNGFWYPAHHLMGILHCRSHFNAIDSDVLLVTAPKTGSTWLKALVFTLFNRPVNDFDSHPLASNNPHDLIPFLEINHYGDPKRVPDLSDLPSPRLLSTHIPASSLPTTILHSGCKIVYLCRDPRDTLISLWHFSNKLVDPTQDGVHELSLEDAVDSFCSGASDIGPFWDHILEYWKLSVEMPSKVMLLTYEEMKGDTEGCLRRLAAFLGCPFSEEEDNEGVVERIVELCSFDHLSGLEINKSGKLPQGHDNKIFFRRGQVKDWLNYLTTEMSLRLKNVINDKLHVSGFNYY